MGKETQIKISNAELISQTKINIDETNALNELTNLENQIKANLEYEEDKMPSFKLLRQIQVDKIKVSEHLNSILLKKYEIDARFITENKELNDNRVLF